MLTGGRLHKICVPDEEKNFVAGQYLFHMVAMSSGASFWMDSNTTTSFSFGGAGDTTPSDDDVLFARPSEIPFHGEGAPSASGANFCTMPTITEW